MTYGILLRPYANGRYQEAVRPLALKELELLLRAARVEAKTAYREIAGVDWLVFSADSLSVQALETLRKHSSLYLLCRIDGDSMQPLTSSCAPCLGQDISGILKYKGKTNEAFTRLLLNYALYSGDYCRESEKRLCLLDFMCGRGTTLFEGLNMGMDAAGMDIDRNDLDEGCRFLKKYLEYHRIKHTVRSHALTVPGTRMSVQARTFSMQCPNAGTSPMTAEFLCGDAAQAGRALPEKHFHLAVCDLPYGVQHGPAGAAGFDQLLPGVLPRVYAALKPGAALALSFNTHTLLAAKVRRHLEESGFCVCAGEAYEGLEHWVEQAIMRDVMVGVRPH